MSPRTTVQLSATDNKAGVKNIYYRIDGKERFIFGEAFKLPNVAGLHTVKYDANDNVENLSGNTFVPLYMDNNTQKLASSMVILNSSTVIHYLSLIERRLL